MTESTLINSFFRLMEMKNKNEFASAKKMKGESNPPKKTATQPINTANEEAEQIDEAMTSEHKKLAHDVHKQLKRDESMSPGAGLKLKADHNLLRKKYGSDWRKKAGINEEAEQIDETSHKKLSSGQKHIAKQAGDPNKIDAADFKKLRATKEEVSFSDAELAHIQAVMEAGVSAAPKPRDAGADELIRQHLAVHGAKQIPAVKPEQEKSAPATPKPSREQLRQKAGLGKISTKTAAGHAKAPGVVALEKKDQAKKEQKLRGKLDAYKAARGEEHHDDETSQWTHVTTPEYVQRGRQFSTGSKSQRHGEVPDEAAVKKAGAMERAAKSQPHLRPAAKAAAQVAKKSLGQ